VNDYVYVYVDKTKYIHKIYSKGKIDFPKNWKRRKLFESHV